MRDRDPEQLNKKDDLVDVKELVRDAEPGPFTLDDILAEYGVKREPEPEAVPRRIESRSQPQRTEKDNVVLFPGARSAPVPEPPQEAEEENVREPEEDTEPESGEDTEDREGEDEEPNDRVVEFPEEESVLSAFLKDVTRKADHYADHMFQESEEMDQEEIHRLEKLIPGTDVEEDEPEELPGRFRRPRRPEPPPPDTCGCPLWTAIKCRFGLPRDCWGWGFCCPLMYWPPASPGCSGDGWGWTPWPPCLESLLWPTPWFWPSPRTGRDSCPTRPPFWRGCFSCSTGRIIKGAACA